MADLIDRQEAINMVKDMYQGLSIVQASYSDIGRALVKFLNLVPSAQPTQPNTPNALESLDCVSRQAAIDVLREYIVDNGMYDMDENVQGFNDGISCAISELSVIPSAQPEIVRCKDCKYGSPNGEYGCRVYHFKLYEKHEMNADDFCSRAERREE